jgi:hypothetical protein
MEALQILNRIEEYGFECEAGPLKNCVDWQKLRALLETKRYPDGMTEEDDRRFNRQWDVGASEALRASPPEAVERDAERYRWLRDLALAWQWKDLAKFAYEENPNAVDDAVDSFRSRSPREGEKS